MALSLSPSLRYTTHLSKPNSTSKLTTPNLIWNYPLLCFRPVNLRNNHTKLHAVTDLRSNDAPGSLHQPKDEADDHKVLVGPSSEEESKGDRIVADYDWTEEWYPLYLTKDVPDDAPLGLTVFDQQLVLYKDGNGVLHCYQDRCPHRLAKLSEGQLVDGRLECLYHGWQFEGNGQCVKIPQLPADAKIPRSACLKTYEVKDSQGVVWVWMSQKTPPKPEKLPWFENFARPGFQDVSTIHELPYDHSILLENLMDPAHIPISHDRTDWTAKREDAQPLLFEVTERTDRGFAGWWGKEKDGSMPNFLRFDAPCVLQNNRELVDKDGQKNYFTGLFLCRPTGQGKSMLIVRKWMDKVGHGMPYHFGHSTISPPKLPAVVEHAPAGLVAGTSASSPAKGGIGSMHAPNLANRYFRHVIHCKGCSSVVKAFTAWKNGLSAAALAFTALAILASSRQWKSFLLVSATLCLGGVYACSTAIAMNTTNFIRVHRRL
ncbi:Pheophorbide a oxygenase [Corchorus olitorius]|uniref:Pheophorbide a oxygenase n=1 Tax=Corchorus olitorius TaxID=93759 RepID=A0A1R3J774_9ROSI|nr:Pheophorbide a oxygenase [Corchorus olitorius]